MQVGFPIAYSGKRTLIGDSGTISADGGSIVSSAAHNAVNTSGAIDAHSISGHNGSITIGGGAGGGVKISGTLDVSGNRYTRGGSVVVTGQKTRLVRAAINASGGSVFLGGDLHGSGAIQQAHSVTMDAASVIYAGATVQ